MGAGNPIDPFNLLLPRGAPQQLQQTPATPPDPMAGLPSLPLSNDTLEIPQQQQASNNTLEIPQQFDPYAARPELIDSIVQHESGGKATATGQKGEVGLMQIMPATAAQYGVTPEQLADPTINKQVGTRYFSDLLKKYKGNEWLALVAYNEGPGNLAKGQFLPQSVKYATSVLERAGSRLKGLTGGMAGLAGGQPAMQFPPGFGGQQAAPQGALAQGGQPQMQFPPGMGPGNLPGQPPSQQMAQFIPPGMMGGGPAQQALAQQPQQQAQEGPAAARLQQMLAPQGPQLKYGPLGQQPIQADIAGESYDPRIARQMTQIAAGTVGGPEAGEEEIAQLSGRARGMIKRARDFGVDPANIASLARRVRTGGMSEDNLSMALKDLKARLPEAGQAAGMIGKYARKYGEDMPQGIRAAISQAIREGKITRQQAARMLKAGVGGLGIGAFMGAEGAGGSTPAQPGQFQPQGGQQQPGLMSRLLGEGTAYAEEPPTGPGALPPTSVVPGGGTPAAGPSPGATPPAAGAPSAAPTPALPAPSGPLTMGPTITLGRAPQPQQAKPKLTMQHLTYNSGTGTVTATLAPPKLPIQSANQLIAAKTAQAQVADAADYYDKNILPNEAKYEGGLKDLMKGDAAQAFRGVAQWPEYRYSRWMTFLADQHVDPKVAAFYSRLGPVMGAQLKAIIGGRVGQYMITGPLAPHIPNPETDDLHTMRMKLDHMKTTLPLVVNAINKARSEGLGEDEQAEAGLEAGGYHGVYNETTGELVGGAAGAPVD